MCGLVGIYSSNMVMKHKDVLSSMLYLDTWRGSDSTGVAALRQNADTHILKSTVPGYEFIQGPRLDAHLKLNDFLWIGHNRHGTMGRNVKTNSHPFEILDEDGACLLVGAHNGTLKNKHVLDDHVTFGTDSEALFSQIANHTLQKAIPMIEGAWALTYYDHVDEELVMIRNDERPLCYAWEEGKKTLYWASEAWMLRIATSRHGIKLEEDTVYSLPVNQVFTFPVPLKMNEEIVLERKGALLGKQPAFFHQNGGKGGGTVIRTTRQEALDKLEQTRLENLRRAQQAAQQISNTAFGTHSSKDGEKQTSKSDSTLKLLPKPEEQGNVVPITGRLYKGYAGVKLSLKELTKQLDDGCSWCELEAIEPEDAFAWLAPEKPVCNKCLKGVPEMGAQEFKEITRH
jgi:predicted glutamine amidotransferase